jgi:predicted 3-demethylubiquinone-9 3-methyltransferase (glyoxalase superfamily)
MIPCKDQEELDYYYGKLSAVPEAEMCGWVADKYGVSWQLIPENFTKYMKSGAPE